MAANVTIPDDETVDQYTSIGESIFPYTFPILASDELKVSVDQVLQVLGVDYTLLGIGDDAGGSVTFVAPTTAGELITLYQDMPFKRLTGFTLGAATLLPEDLNTEFVRQVRQDQQVRRNVGLALRLAVDDPQQGQDMIIPTQATRAGEFLAFDASGKPTTSPGSGGGDLSLRTDLASADAAKGFNLLAITKSPAEISAAVTVVNTHLDVGDPNRYTDNANPGVTDMESAFNDAASVMAPASALVTPGTYLIPGTVTGAFHSFGGVTIVTGAVNTIINLSLNLGSVANGLGASLIGLEDAAGLLVAANVEAGIAELANNRLFAAIKLADTDRASTTVVVNDPDLQVSVPIAGLYRIECFVTAWGTASGAGGLKTNLNYASAGSERSIIIDGFINGNSLNDVVGVVVPGQTTVSRIYATLGTAAEVEGIRHVGYLRFAAAGSLNFAWAQNASNVNATNIGRGSFITATRLGA